MKRKNEKRGTGGAAHAGVEERTPALAGARTAGAADVSSSVIPPCSNRGVVCRDTHVLIDWLRFSKPKVKNGFKALRVILSAFLGTSSVATSAIFGHAYKGIDLAVHGSLTWRQSLGGPENKTPLDDTYDLIVDLPAQALEFIRTQLHIDEQKLCEYFLAWGFHGTRVDATMDTRQAQITPQFVYQQMHAARDLFCGESQTLSWGHKEDIRSGRGLGQTLYIGSRGKSSKGQSSRYACVYDKVSEFVGKKGLPLIDDDGFTIDHMTRFELRHNGKDAAGFAVEHIAAVGVTAAVRDLWRGWCDFKDPKSRKRVKNKKHAKSAAWWLRMVGEGAKVKPGLCRTSTPAKTEKWMKTALPGVMACQRKYGDVAGLEKSIEDAKPNRKKIVQWEIYAREREQAEINKQGLLFSNTNNATNAIKGRLGAPAKRKESTRAHTFLPEKLPTRSEILARREGDWTETKKRLRREIEAMERGVSDAAG